MFFIFGVFSISCLYFVFQKKTNTDLLFKRGIDLIAHEHYLEGIKKFQEALKESPNNPEILVELGNAYGKTQNFSEQFNVCQQAIKSEPKSARAWLCSGNAEQGLGRYKKSIEDFDQAIDFACNFKDQIAIQERETMNQDCADAWNKKGEFFSALDNRQEALNAFEQAIQKNPNHHVAWTKKGEVLLRQQSFKEAETAFKKALDIQQNYQLAKEGLNKAQERLKKAQEPSSQ